MYCVALILTRVLDLELPFAQLMRLLIRIVFAESLKIFRYFVMIVLKQLTTHNTHNDGHTHNDTHITHTSITHTSIIDGVVGGQLDCIRAFQELNEECCRRFEYDTPKQHSDDTGGWKLLSSTIDIQPLVVTDNTQDDANVSKVCSILII